MYTLLKQEGRARRGQFQTVHGTVQTPAFMNVATAAAIKGGISAYDLKELKCQVMLCNTYHLHLRPGDNVVRQLGGLHRFTGWQGPILTDSGGFQVFSLASLRHIEEKGVTFASHIDGHRIFMGPEESMQIQSHLGSTIAMAFDECIENPSPRDYVQKSVARTTRWLGRCQKEMARLNSLEAQRQRLEELRAQAGNLEDLLAIENQLTQVQYQIESYTGQKRVLDDQITYSTVNVYLDEVKVLSPTSTSFGSRIARAFTEGWRGFGHGLQDMAVALVGGLPWLLVLGLAIAGGTALYRRRPRRPKQPGGYAAPQPAPQKEQPPETPLK